MNLPNMQETDIRDPESIRRAVQHSNLVINCIGANYETRNFSFNDVHVDGPRLIARIARECGVEKLIHFSSLNASPDPQTIFKQSQFLISKVSKSGYPHRTALSKETPRIQVLW